MEKEQACCDELPVLTREDISNNVGSDLTHYPSLYEEIFDAKHFNDLINDPMLNTGQMETTEKNGNGAGQSVQGGSRPVQGNGPSTSANRKDSQDQNGAMKCQNVQGQESGSSRWSRPSGNYYGNSMETASAVQSVAPSRVQPHPPQYPPPAWQDRPVFHPSDHQSGSKPLASSNLGHSNVSIGPGLSFVHVKPEPRDIAESPIDQDQDDHEYLSEPRETPTSIGVSRGAVYAREYRRKTKSRITKLEEDNQRLSRENAALKEAYREARVKLDSSNREVVYLRQVLANDGTIAHLLNTVMTNSPGLKFQCPSTSGQRPEQSAGSSASGAHGGNPRPGWKRMLTDGNGNSNSHPKQRQMDENEVRRVREGIQRSGESPGVCLHVNGDLVSIEFCPRCNRDARRGCGDTVQ